MTDGCAGDGYVNFFCEDQLDIYSRHVTWSCDYYTPITDFPGFGFHIS